MNKLISLILCVCTFQISFAQSEKADIRGAMKISNSDSQNPVEGTIRWTGQDFEGFDGTEWKSLTCCSDGESPDAIISCPSNFVLDNCNVTVNWTHDNPVSTTVNYDLRISVSPDNVVDPSLSVTYPATSNTVNFCESLSVSSGTGTLTIELLYWYDGDVDAAISVGICMINYDLGDSSLEGKTFAQIEADSDLPTFCSMSDDAYVAEYLYQHPDVYYWEVQTLSNGQKSVVPLPVPLPPSNAIQLPSPSGGNDTGALESVINGNGANKVFIGSGTYKVNQLDIDQAGTVIYNMPVTPASGAGELIHINADDVKLIDCPQDFQNQSSGYLGIRAQFADRFHLIRSGLTNMFHTAGSSGGGVYIRACADFHIAGGVYKNILNKQNGTNTCRANVVWINGGNSAITDGGYIVNNIAENLQSTGNPNNGDRDAEFFTTQSNTGHLKQIKLFANRCVDAGKRLVKAQGDGGVTALSNSYEWRTNSTVLGNRARLNVISVQLSVSDVIARNNRIAINGNRNWSYVMYISAIGISGTNIHFDCNTIEINNPWNGANYDQRVLCANSTAGSSGSDTSQENINCTMNDNTIFGTGGVNYHYWFGNGFDLNSGLLQPSGNTFNLTGPGSPHQGIEKQ